MGSSRDRAGAAPFSWMVGGAGPSGLHGCLAKGIADRGACKSPAQTGAGTECSETGRAREHGRWGQTPWSQGKTLVSPWERGEASQASGQRNAGIKWGSSLTVAKCFFSWVEPLMLEASWEIPFQRKCWFMKVHLARCNKSHEAEYILSLKNSMPGNSSWG